MPVRAERRAALVNNWYKTLPAPLGFSYDLFGNGKTVLRGGFGTFFEREQGNDIYDIAGRRSIRKHTVGRATWNSPTPATTGRLVSAASTPLFTQGPNSEDTYYPAPGVEQYSLGVQHEVAPALILVTQYVGNIAWHQNTVPADQQLPAQHPDGNPSGVCKRHALDRRRPGVENRMWALAA